MAVKAMSKAVGNRYPITWHMKQASSRHNDMAFSIYGETSVAAQTGLLEI